jgi:hypothetical protein
MKLDDFYDPFKGDYIDSFDDLSDLLGDFADLIK